ncbi:hypothetical protein SBOR_2449 [Sclerotinia borealis F-4128]|uniref:Rhodopsin domain-containing protein n=1 Tax=Sclerotinia borealis (strain F-4128) TaxID=1432307 RepID=W9CMD3_SCLBF|nr:hypothetical protein SBOR_2449 [Sclerotinia borealis F-4128]
MIENTVQVAHTAYAVTAVVFLLACTRFLLRRLKNERISPDDWLMVVALVFLAGNTSAYPVLLSTGEGPHAIGSVETVAEKEFDSKYILFGRICYLTYIWLLKACILTYYYRLTTRQPEQKYVKITSWGICLTWTTTILIWALQCRPFDLNWKVTVPPQKCATGQVGLLFMTIAIIVTNIILIIIPLPMIWRTQMAIFTKFKVSGVFLVGIFLVVISILRFIMQEGGSNTPDDRFFWGELECLAMAFFANAPVLNALYRRYKNGVGSNHLASRSRTRTARNTGNVELCTNDDSREIDFVEALRGGPEPIKQPDHVFMGQPLPPVRIASSPPLRSESKRKASPNVNTLLSVSRSRGGNRDSLHCIQTVEVVQTSEPADPRDPMMTNPLGGVGRVETQITHHDSSPLPSNPDLYTEMYASGHRSMTLEDMLADRDGPSRRR